MSFMRKKLFIFKQYTLIKFHYVKFTHYNMYLYNFHNGKNIFNIQNQFNTKDMTK